jgi:hypothetical protein
MTTVPSSAVGTAFGSFIPFAEVGEIARLCVHHVRCWWSLPLRRNIGMSQWANTAITRVITISRSEFS